MTSKDLFLVPLREVLIKSEDWIDINPTEKYKQVTVKIWGKGVVERNEVTGAEIAASKRLKVHYGQFILSRIDARHGAFGLIPNSLDGAVVTNDFPVFTPNSQKILPQFLDWMSKTKDFIELCKAASEGTTNRVRLKEDKFLSMKIPLPALEEQRRIVARVEELAGKFEEVRSLRQKAFEETEVLLQSARRRLIGSTPDDGWIPLTKYVKELENGWSPACESRPATIEEWGVLKLGAVSFGSFNENENKALPINLEPKPEYEVHPGDFLMSRANTLELVGACTIVVKTRLKLILCDKIFRFIFREDSPVILRYLDHVLKSPAIRDQIERGASGTSPTMKNISKEKVLNLLIPYHSIPEQHRIVAYLDQLQTKVDTMKRLREQAMKELDALLPSILDKAFKGEL